MVNALLVIAWILWITVAVLYFLTEPMENYLRRKGIGMLSSTEIEEAIYSLQKMDFLNSDEKELR